VFVIGPMRRTTNENWDEKRSKKKKITIFQTKEKIPFLGKDPQQKSSKKHSQHAKEKWVQSWGVFFSEECRKSPMSEGS